MPAHDFNFTTIDGKPLEMKSLAGRPVLVVNVASYCGFTPQYTDLQKLHDTYKTNVPLADFSADDVMLAWSWNGEPISREHGGPLRVVIPKLYFWKSAKWIKRIEFSAFDKPGFWEVRGYHNYGDPWLEQRYDEEP